MTDRWYYQMLREEFGPVTGQQLRQLIEEGTLSTDDLVRPEESARWIAVGSMGDHSTPDNSGPAEITDLSELSFSFEQTGPTQRRTAHSKPEPPVVSPPNTPSPLKTPAAAPQEAEADIYYCQSLGQILGPMSLTELTGMAESGSLSDSDPVRLGAKGAWQPASSISELSAALMLSDRGTSEAATISTTTQKRLGPAAVASMNAAAMAENVAAAASQEPAVTETPQAVASIPAAKSPDNKKVRRRTGKKGEEDLIDEILEDVFADNEDQKPSRGSSPGQSSAPASIPPATTSATTGQSRPAYSAPSYSSMSQSPATQASLAMARAAAAARASSKTSRGAGIDFDGPIKFVAIGILLISVIGGLIWQFGLPSFSGGGSIASKYAPRMTLAVKNYKSLGEKPSPGPWEEFCSKTRSEFEIYHKGMVDSGASGAKNKACMDGMQAIIALTNTKPEETDRHKELVTKIEQSVAELAK